MVTWSFATGWILWLCLQCHHAHLVELNNQQETGHDFFECFVPTCFPMTIHRVLALTAISSWHSLDYNTVTVCLSSPVLSPKANTCTWRRHLAMLMTETPTPLCKELTSACAHFSSMSSSLSWSLRPYSHAWLQTDARSCQTSQVNSRPHIFSHHWQFLSTWVSFLRN